MRNISMLCMLLITLPVWAGTLVDNFGDGNFDGWTPHNCIPEAQCGQWTVRDSVLYYKGPAERSLCYLTMGNDNWGDYTINCRARMLRGLWQFSRIAFAIHMAKALGTSHIYHVFGPTPAGVTAGIGVFDGGGGNENSKVVNMEFERWYELRAEAAGTTYNFFIDGELVVSHQINSHRTGGLRIGCASAEVELDDMVIAGNDVPDLVSAITPQSKLAITWASIKSY